MSQRIVCNVVEKAGGVLKIPLAKGLRTAMSAVKDSSTAHIWKQFEDAKQSKRHCIDEEIDTIKTNKRKLEATIAGLTASADAYAEKAEKRK